MVGNVKFGSKILVVLFLVNLGTAVPGLAETPGDPNQMIGIVLTMMAKKAQHFVDGALTAARTALQGAVQINQEAAALEAYVGQYCANQGDDKDKHKKNKDENKNCRGLAPRAMQLREQARGMVSAAMGNVQHARDEEAATEEKIQMASVLGMVLQQQNNVPANSAGNTAAQMVPMLASLRAQQQQQQSGYPAAPSTTMPQVPQY